MGLQNLSRILDKYEEQLSSLNQEQFQVLQGLPFYHWDKPKEEQQGTFVGTVGLPIKNDTVHGFYDYEQSIIDYIETDEPTNPKNRHLYILKSSGLGITTLLLYYIGWKCTTDNSWSSGRVCILTAPRLELTIDIVDRLKGIFRRWNDSVSFDTRSTVCNINNTKVEAFPSHLGLKGMRGLTDIKMIVCDEASFFDESQINEARDTIERYWSKSNPIIVLCSTPNRPDDLMDLIHKEPEDRCIYHRMYLDYRIGLGKIYSEQEIALQRLSPSFPREYDLKFAGKIGNVFSTKGIDLAIQKGKELGLDQKVNQYTVKSLGIDPGFGGSASGIVITELVNGTINVLYADELTRATFDEVINKVVSLMEEYQITFENRCRVFCDGSNPAILRAIKERVDEDINYEQHISFLKKSYPSVYDLDFLAQNMMVIPVPFAKYHREMLAHCKEMLEYQTGQVAIHPRFNKLITALRTATEKGDGSLDKEMTSFDDTLDSFRLSLMFWH